MIKYEHKEYNITEADIIDGKCSINEILEILWHGIDVYDGEVPYEKDAKKFTPAQRGISAIMWYDFEVGDGGHYKFFNESSGTVWKDTIGGLRLIGALNVADILESAIEKFNGDGEFFVESFAEYDKQYKENSGELESLIKKYISENPAEFVFSGVVDVPIDEE